MSDSLIHSKPRLVLLMTFLLVLPIGISTVTLGSGTIIEQTANDVEIVVDSEFNVSELEVYDSATEFGGTNFSVTHDDAGLVHVNMSKFNNSVPQGDLVTDFKANATSGTSMNFQFSNLTENQYFVFRKNSNIIENSSTSSTGDFSTSVSFQSSGFDDFSLEASARDVPVVNVDVNKTEAYNQSEVVGVTGTVTRQSTGAAIEDADVKLYDDGTQIATGLSTDSNGDFNYSFDVGKNAGEFEIKAEANKSGITGNGSTTYQVGTIFLEAPQVSGNNFIDIEDTPNASVKSYGNTENPVDVLFRVSDGISLLNQGSAQNVTDAKDTQRFYHEVLDWGLGEFNIEFSAESQLGGDTITEFQTREVDFVVQNISLSLDTDRESYGIGSGQQVDVTGTAILKNNDTPVTNEQVNIDVINTSSGSIINSYTATTDSNGDFLKEYNFVSDPGVRRVNASIVNSNGIDGEAETEYSVTNMDVYSIGFSDSSEFHGYNVTGFLSDSSGISSPEDYTCEFNISDGEGNNEIYTQGINESYGDAQQATCTQPNVASINNSGWDHLEELTTEITLTRNSVQTSSSSSRSLPNNAPDVIQDTEISLEYDSSTFRYQINATAEDGDIPGSNEINNCYITYIGDQKLSRQKAGTLDKSYGGPEEALCRVAIDPSNSTVERNELIEARVNFNDTHGEIGRSTTTAGPVPIDAEFRNFDDDPVSAEINVSDPDTGDELKVLSTGSDGKILGSVPRGTFDVGLTALNKKANLLDTRLDSSQEWLVEVGDDLDATDSIDRPFVESELEKVAYNVEGINYDRARINLDYSNSESVISGWRCDNFNYTSFELNCIDTYEEADYTQDAVEDMISIQDSELDGAYTLADTSGWKDEWAGRQIITVEGGERDVRDYQVKISLNTSRLFIEDYLVDNCGSLRFFSTSQDKELDYWLEPGTCGQGDTEVWIEMDYLPADSSRQIYMYAGNEGVTSSSSGTQTFLDFDEFNSAPGSDYSTTGDVAQSDGKLIMRSKDGVESEVTYTESMINTPYRFMTTFNPSEDADNSSISTLVNSSGSSVELDSENKLFSSDYSSMSESLNIPYGELDINTSIYGDEQSLDVRYSEGSDSSSLTGSVVEQGYPFSTSITEDSGTPSQQSIERWYTAKLVRGASVQSISSLNDAWTLTLNGKEEEVKVGSGVDVTIDVESQGRNADLTGYVNDEEEFSAVDTRSATFITNFSKERYYEIRFEIDGFSKSLIGDVIVGDDNQAPKLYVTGITQADDSIDINFNVNDNFLGDMECQAIVNGDVRNEKRVANTNNNVNTSAEISVTNLDSDDTEIGVKCSDQTGNSDSEFFPDDVDLSGPEIEIETPKDGGSQLRVRPRLEVNMTDQSTESLDYELSYPDSSKTATGTIQNNTLSEVFMKAPSEYGEKTIAVKGTDKNGFSRTKYVTIELTKPYVNISSPAPDTVNSSVGMFGNPTIDISPERIESLDGDESFTYEYTTEARTNSKCHLEVDGKTYNTTSMSVNQTELISASSIDEGYDVPVRVKCDTEAGTNISKEMRISIDRTKPDFTVLEQRDWENNSDYSDNSDYQLRIETRDNHETPGATFCNLYGNCYRTGDRNPYLEINNTYGHIMFRHNFTGTMENKSVQCNTENWYRNSDSGTECRDDFTIDNEVIPELEALDSGTYNYKIWVRDDVGNVRETNTRTLVVEKEQAGVNLEVSDRAEKGYIINGTSPRLKCSVRFQESSLVLDRNNNQINSSTTTAVTDFSNRNVAGTYNYNCSIGSTGNYEDGFSVFNLGVRGWAWNSDGSKNFNDPDSDNYVEAGVNLSLDTPSTPTSPEQSFMEGTSYVAPRTNDDWNITYGDIQTIQTESRSGNNELYVDGINKGESLQKSFTPGEYVLKANSSGFPRFLPEGITKTMRVKKATPNLNINSNASLQPEVGEFFNLTCSSSTSQNNLELRFDGTTIDSGTNVDTVGEVLNASDIGRGEYSTECVSSESQNYTQNNISRTVDIQTNKPDMNFKIKPESEVSFVGNARDIFNNGENGYAVRPNREITVTCNTIQEVGTTLEVDSTEVASPYTTTYSTLDDHVFTCASDKTPIFDVREEEKILSVKEDTETELYLNSSRSDITVSQSEAYNLNISANLNITNNIELWELSDPDYRDSDGFGEYDKHDDPNGTRREFDKDLPAYNNPNGSITNARIIPFGDGRTGPEQIVPGSYVYRASHPYTDNSYYSSETFTVDVQDTIAPRISLNIQDEEALNTKTPEIRANTQDFSGYTCSLYVDGVIRNVNAGNGGGFSLDYYSSFSGNQTTWGENEDLKLNGRENDRARIARTAGLSLTEGDHNVRVSCTDDSGNVRENSKEFTVDTTPPNVAFVNGNSITASSSTPDLQIFESDGVSSSVDVEIFSLTEGKIADQTVSGTEGVPTRSLGPGNYELYAEATDGVGLVGNSTESVGGNGDLVDLEIPTTLIYNMSPSSNSIVDGRFYTNKRDVNLSFKAASKDLNSFGCTVSINASGINDISISNVENNSETGAEVTGLSDGVYSWSASCDEGNLYDDTSFVVDSTRPVAEDTGVTRESGLVEQEEEITFYVEPSDNFKVDQVNITAEWLSTHPMDCGSDGFCTYETTVPPGEYDYNYTICDAANNCETTTTEGYSVASSDDAMELRLNGDVQNVSLDETPVLNISSQFSNGVRGDSTFSFEQTDEEFTGFGTGLAQSTDAISTQFQQRFYQNGTYAIKGQFRGTTDSGDLITDTDYLFVDVNLTERQVSNFGYQIYNLQKGNASLRNDPGFSPTIPRNGIVNTRKIVLGEGLGTGLAAQFTAKFNKDLNAENISFDTDKSSRKSVISFESVYNQIQSHSLLVPRVEDSGKVLVCPSADTLDEIVLGCTGAINVSSGETKNGITNTEVVINGDKYYHIEGIDGTGAQELSVDSGIESPNRANVTDQEVLDEWSRSLPAEGDLDLDGGNISTADLSTQQATDHWAGIYGNATGQITLGSESLFYEWEAKPKTIFAANDTVNWDTLQTATLNEIDNYYGIAGYSDSASDTLNETADFTVGGIDIEDAPSARTYNGTQVPLWITGALSDSETPVLAGKAYNNDSTAFTGEIANYQMIVPTGGDFVVPYAMYMELE